MSTIKITGVSEHDVDLLMLEEFVSSQPFARWFLSQLKVEDIGSVLQAEHSITTSNGESDLELTFQRNGRLLKLLIENKVDAAFQPNQPARYVERAKTYLATGQYESVITVVIAPAGYFEQGKGLEFDYQITYEALIHWFEIAEELGARGTFKQALLNAAIERERDRWQLVADKNVTEFWRKYWELTRQMAPALRMPKPGDKPSSSNFIQFKPLELAKGVQLWHKLPHGNVDLQFAGMGESLPEMQERYGALTGPNMSIERANKSAVIRLSVPVISTAAPFEQSESAARQGIDASLKLLQWYKDASSDLLAQRAPQTAL